MPLPENPPWWKLFGVEEAQMFEVCRVMHELYLRPKAQHIPVCRPPLTSSKPGTPTPARHQEFDGSVDRLPTGEGTGVGISQLHTGQRTWPHEGSGPEGQLGEENSGPGVQVSCTGVSSDVAGCYTSVWVLRGMLLSVGSRTGGWAAGRGSVELNDVNLFLIYSDLTLMFCIRILTAP